MRKRALRVIGVLFLLGAAVLGMRTRAFTYCVIGASFGVAAAAVVLLNGRKLLPPREARRLVTRERPTRGSGP